MNKFIILDRIQMKCKYMFLLPLALVSGYHSIIAQVDPPSKVQNVCGTPVPDAEWENQFSLLVNQTKTTLNNNKQQAVPYTIPVIIHVIHGGQTVGTYPNIASGQLISQIQVLNNDYGGIGYNSWLYPLNAFVGYANSQAISFNSLDALNRVKIANCGVQFCLATKDTLGNILAEPGIERISYVSRGWNNPASYGSSTSFQTYMNGTVKPQTIWNVSKYLNIWVTDVNIASSGLLGYATFPVMSNLTGFSTLSNFLGTNTSDGFWCYAKAFGSSQIYPAGTYYQNYTFGRTSTHEIGHWLGLRHIWGDANCATDYCDDTPPAKASNFGSLFGYPYHSGTCNGNSPNGEMMMDFMDYTNDNAKYMFTNDQAIRIQTAMQNSPYRKFLGSHNLCSITEIAASSNFNTASIICEGAALTLSNQSLGTPVPSYTWSANGSPAFFPNANAALTVSFPAPGIYTITLSSFNGTLSVVSKTVTVKPSPSLTLTPQRTNYCLGENISLNLEGGTSYVWQPDSITDSYVFVPNDKPSSFSYSCSVTGTNSCKTNTVISINVIDCTGMPGGISEDNYFTVFPNPTSNKMTIEGNKIWKDHTQLELIDILGHTILVKTIDFNEQKNAIEIDLSDFNKGLFILKIIKDSQLICSKIIVKQ